MKTKRRQWTDEQEREFQSVEDVLTRARIMERGVAAVLNGEFLNDSETRIASLVLREAVDLKKNALEIRERMHREAEPPRRDRPRRGRRI